MIEKMKFVQAVTDRARLDHMLMEGLNSGLIHAVEASGMVNEENGGAVLTEDNPYIGYVQTLENFAHAVSYSFAGTKTPERDYTNADIKEFFQEINEKFGIKSDAEHVILTPDDEKALDALAECGFERIHACSYLNFGLGRLPRESFPKLGMYNEKNFVHHRLHENKQYIWMVYVTSDSYAEEVRKIFQSLYFEEMEIPRIDVHRLLHEYQDRLEDVYAFCQMKRKIIDNYKYIAKFSDRYYFSGFVAERNVREYQDSFNDIPVNFTIKEPYEVKEYHCPTLLRNHWFAKPFELFVEMYSLPNYSDFDPTLFFALTYCILFGIMFADMGQGILLMIVGFLLERKGKLFGIIGRCGIFATIFGFLFGSFFGFEEFLTPIHQFLFHTEEKLFDVMANQNTMTLLIGALVIGAFLIICSQILNVYNTVRHQNWEELIFSQNGIAGMVFYLYLLLAFGLKLGGQVNILTLPWILICIIVPCICFLMKEPFGRLIRHQQFKPEEGWGAFFLQNSFEVFEILLSFVTNSMSYLRVGGFVLSHAGMMLVVMTLMKMVAHGGIGVLVFGNLFVMLLEGLVVGIQSLRLEYYEMFSRYYKGGGVKYEVTAA